MRKVKFNDQCSMKGTGYFHGFFNGEYGPMVVVEILEGEGEQTSKKEMLAEAHHFDNEGKIFNSGLKPIFIPKLEVRPFERGQVVTCHAGGVTFLDESPPKPTPEPTSGKFLYKNE